MNPAFSELLSQIGEGNLPPVEVWNPEKVGNIDIRIRRDGKWLHEGRVIERESIAKVFSTILRKDGDDYYLVTPVEKLRINVEDTPFTVVDMESNGDREEQQILLKTNFGDVVPLDQEHPLVVEEDGDTFKPTVRVRGKLTARLLNSVYARFADLVEDEESLDLYVCSFGTKFWVP